MYKNGTGKESLLSVLQTLDELTSIDRITHSGQKIHIDAEMSGKSFQWAMGAEFSGYNSTEGIQVVRGKGYPALAKALRELDNNTVVDEAISVLALAGTEPARNYNGTINTVWYAIDPCGIGFSAKQKFDKKKKTSVVEYPIVELVLTEAEYRCCASRLALYNEFDGILYPIMECAFKSLNALLDCGNALQFKNQVPLASAMLLAERIANAEDTRFISRARTDKVKPLVSLVGSRYIPFSQHSLIRTICDAAQRQFICHVAGWQVTANETQVTIVLDGFNAYYSPELCITTGDVFGKSTELNAYIRMGRGKILLRKNTERNRIGKEGATPLFAGIFEAIKAFEESFLQCSGDDVVFSVDMLTPIQRIVGKRRAAKIEPPTPGKHLLAPLVFQIVDSYGGEMSRLNRRWGEELSKSLGDLYNKLSGEDVVVSTVSKLPYTQVTVPREQISAG